MRLLVRLLACASCVAAAAACSGSGSGASTDGGTSGAPDLGPANALVAKRPYNLDVPSGYDGIKPLPVVILLHGYSANGFVQHAYFGLTTFADQHGVLLAYP